MTYKVKVTQVHPSFFVNGDIRPKYKIDIDAEDWHTADYMYSRLFTKRYAKRLIKKHVGDEFEPKVVEEFEL